MKYPARKRLINSVNEALTYFITSHYDYDYNELDTISNTGCPRHVAGEMASAIAGAKAHVEFSCCTEPGRQRERNEDACAVPPAAVETGPKGILLVLADGVGGYPGGADASQQAVHYLQALYYADTGPDHPAERLRLSVEAVNALARLKKSQMGQEIGFLTTLVAAVVAQDQIWVANVGDSRAYLIHAAKKKRRQLTEDHSGQVRLLKAGLVSDPQAERTTSTITRAIGLQEDCQVDTYHYSWQPGDCLVLCSDGLFSLPESEMVSIVLEASAPAAADRLVARAIELDGSDNCTVVVGKWLLEPKPSPVRPTVRSKDISPTLPAASIKEEKRRPWKSFILWMLLGLLIGLASAAVIVTIWLNASGLIHLFE